MPAPVCMMGYRIRVDKRNRPLEPVTGLYASEKLDGIRCFWDGQQAYSKRGRRIPAPPWFVEGFPSHPLDGELYAGPGTRARMTGIARRAENPWWSRVRYMVFDIPGKEPFARRAGKLSRFIPRTATIGKLAHSIIKSRWQLKRRLDGIVCRGGEGIILRDGSREYVGGRSRGLLKYKPYGRS